MSVGPSLARCLQFDKVQAEQDGLAATLARRRLPFDPLASAPASTLGPGGAVHEQMKGKTAFTRRCSFLSCMTAACNATFS